MPTYVPLPAQLTMPIAAPTPPPAACSWKGVPVVCAGAGLLGIDDWRGALQRCNVDRAAAARIQGKPAT